MDAPEGANASPAPQPVRQERPIVTIARRAAFFMDHLPDFVMAAARRMCGRLVGELQTAAHSTALWFGSEEL
jgi:hypothetical protein